MIQAGQVSKDGGRTAALEDTCSSIVQDRREPPLTTDDYANQFMHACKHGQVEVARCLVSRGLVDIDRPSTTRGRTPVMIAAKKGHFDVFALLIRLGCDLDVKDEDGSYVLHRACAGGNVDIVRILIQDKHMDKEMKGFHDRTPLHEAAIYGQFHVFDYLAGQGANVSAVSVDGMNALHLAAQGNSVQLVKSLVREFGTESRSNYNTTPVMFAAMQGRVDVLDCLVKEKCNLYAKDSQNSTTLHVACQYGAVNFTKKLIDEYKVSVELKGYMDRTPFLVAAYYNSSRVLSFLASRGSNVLAIDAQGHSALHLAAGMAHRGMVEVLLDMYKLDIDARDYNGLSPLAKAAREGNVETFEFLVNRGANVNVKDRYGDNVLHIATAKRSVAVVETIIANTPIDIHALGYRKLSVLMKAAKYGDLIMFNILHEAGAQLDGVDARGNTIFHYACFGGNLDIVKLLIKLGKENRERNAFKMTPLQVAKKNIKDFLRKRMNDEPKLPMDEIDEFS